MSRTSIPRSFSESITPLLGAESESFLAALEEAPTVAVRLNPRKWSAEEARSVLPIERQVPWHPQGYYLAERPSFTRMPELHQGLFYVQDPSSMIHTAIITELLQDDTTPVRLLDTCAAPGGKTTAAIDALPAGSLVVANEFVSSRAYVLAENLSKWGYPDVIVTNSDTSRLRKCRLDFDIVIVDAPCSGEGMMRKEEVARQQWSESLIRECASLQREILENAVAVSAPGGYLIYSTCTFNLDEDERQVEWLQEEFGLEQVSLAPLRERYGIPGALVEGVDALRFMPHRTEGEGLFVAVLRKPEGEARRQPKERGGKEKPSPWRERIHLPAGYELVSRGDELAAVRGEHRAMLAEIEKNMKVVKAGVTLATAKGKDLIPAQDIVLSMGITPETVTGNTARMEVEREMALEYLAKQALPGFPEAPKGHLLLTYNNKGLGWVKNLGNRANNLYPAEWRIRNL